jgi:hypothetical protein
VDRGLLSHMGNLADLPHFYPFPRPTLEHIIESA